MTNPSPLQDSVIFAHCRCTTPMYLPERLVSDFHTPSDRSLALLLLPVGRHCKVSVDFGLFTPTALLRRLRFPVTRYDLSFIQVPISPNLHLPAIPPWFFCRRRPARGSPITSQGNAVDHSRCRRIPLIGAGGQHPVEFTFRTSVLAPTQLHLAGLQTYDWRLDCERCYLGLKAPRTANRGGGGGSRGLSQRCLNVEQSRPFFRLPHPERLPTLAVAARSQAVSMTFERSACDPMPGSFHYAEVQPFRSAQRLLSAPFLRPNEGKIRYRRRLPRHLHLPIRAPDLRGASLASSFTPDRTSAGVLILSVFD
ncbi:hypothetical protein BD309DRAFT_413403 [Dichomitus squalens]|nr:hypothetical protein BD309DRAFT_413403 [Dichomitus squalens]